MRATLAKEVEDCRVGGEPGSGPHGHFRLLCPYLCRTLTVIASDGRDWGQPMPRPTPEELASAPAKNRAAMTAHLDRTFGSAASVTLPLPAWEHVSVSASTVPVWGEMCWVKDLFWGPEEVVVQYHPPESQYVNVHGRVLHLWKPVGLEIPMPPLVTV
jgi:hypothetical protein